MLATLCLMVLSFLPSAATDEWAKSFKVESTPKVRVETSDANIRVTASEGKSVEARVTTEGWKIGGDGITITDRQNGDTVEIEIRFPRRLFQMNFGKRRVDVEIKTPREANFDLHTGDGNVTMQGLKGEIALHSGDGKITLSELQCTLRAKTGDGNIELRNVKGDVTLNTGDGRIEATGLDGALRAETGDGRVRLNGRFDLLDVQTGDGGIEAAALEGSKTDANWTLKTGNGDITLRLPANLAADVELHTNDGHIDLNLPVTVSGRTNVRDIRGQINGGGRLLSVRTGDGSIRLEKL